MPTTSNKLIPFRVCGLVGSLAESLANPLRSAAHPPQLPSGEPLLVLFGSQTGTAEALAKKLAKESVARGFAPVVFPLNDYETSNLLNTRRLLIVTSTWGDGDPPGNATHFWNWLSSPNAPRLEHLEFSVLGLGDKNYLNFCGASRKFDTRLAELGAHRLAPRGECDVDYETSAQQWMDQLWTNLPTINSSPLLRNVLLNRPGSAKEVRHYEFSLAGSGLEYAVGDALGVLPSNGSKLVEDFLSAAQCTRDETVTVANRPPSFHEALTRQLDITKPSSDPRTFFPSWLKANHVASGRPCSPRIAPPISDNGCGDVM